MAVADVDAPAARNALASASAAADVWVAGEDGKHVRPIGEVGRGESDDAPLLCFRYLVSESGVLLADQGWHVRLEFWQTVDEVTLPRPDGATFERGSKIAPTPNGVVAYLQPGEWDEAASSPTYWLQDVPPDLSAFTQPIDLVYTWVDGDDPAWAERKLRAQGLFPAGEHHADSLATNRFASRDELKYSLRSVAMYAGWVNHIWIVTDQQVPAWLDTTHADVTVIDHREIFADDAALPVFNSHAIESQLHHIEGLAEHYLYMNDDVFFGRPVVPEVFFLGNGIARYFPSTAVIDVTPRSVRDFAVASAAKRNRELLMREFGRSVSNKQRHTPHAQLRSVLQDMECRYPDVFDSVMRSRFRHPDDYAIPSALAHYFAFATGRAVQARIAYGYQDIAAPNADLVLSRWLRQRRLECFCLNDTAVGGPDQAVRDAFIERFLSSYFPVSSPYEKSGATVSPQPPRSPHP